MSFIVRLQNLARSAKSSDIREFFSPLNIPAGSVCIVGGADSGVAFIGFSTDEDVRQALLRDGMSLCQNRVKLTFSSRKEMQEAMERAQQLSSILKGLEKAVRTDPLGKVDLIPNAPATKFSEGGSSTGLKSDPTAKGMLC
jgi:hypothetical protein